jgi:hypothetical protein
MGGNCCREKDNLNPNAKKIMRATTKKLFNAEQILIQTYDMENEIGKEVEINLRFLKLEGMSQLNLNNLLYLCGSQDSNEHSGSTFLSIDPLKQPASVSYLVFSSFSHFHPSMTHFRSEYILVVGGKGSLKCEMFNLRTCKWRNLTDLPEERYGGVLAVDENTNNIFLFGGFNSNSQKIHSSILRLNLKTGLRWDTIVTMTNNAMLLTKCNAAVCKVDRSTVLILGGKTNEQESCDEIIEVNLSAKPSISIKSRFRLNKPTTFSNVNHACEINGHFFNIDDDTMVHKISKIDQAYSVNSFFDIQEDETRLSKFSSAGNPLFKD